MVWVVKLVRILDTVGLMLFSLSPVLKIFDQALAFHQWMLKLYPCFAAFSQTGLPLVFIEANVYGSAMCSWTLSSEFPVGGDGSIPWECEQVVMLSLSIDS